MVGITERSPSLWPRRKAFTLIELLIVILIIGVLAALLLPALGQARARARQAACKNNLRQIALAVLGYADANGGVFPPFRWNDGFRRAPDPIPVTVGEETVWIAQPRWNILIGPYLEGSIDTKVLDPDGDGFANTGAIPGTDDDYTPFGNDVFVCPESPERNTSRNGSYGYNYQFLGNARHFRDPVVDNNLPTGHPGWGPGWVNFPVTTARVRITSRTVLVADCLGTASGLPISARAPYVGTQNRCEAVGNHSYALDPPIPWFVNDQGLLQLGGVSTGDCDPGYAGVDPRHDGECNVVFVDGHVESRTPESLGYVVRPDGSYAFKDLRELLKESAPSTNDPNQVQKHHLKATNEWFSGTGTHRWLPKQWRTAN
jgi:prepilin-type N-terminal cleavage/methylation domain-containing protein/prepilin-type processing-associated H-X9-DG protein